MTIEVKMLLFVALFIVVGTRIVYLYLICWKWNRMIMHYLNHRKHYCSAETIKVISDLCYEIPLKPWMWCNLGFWDPAQECFDNKWSTRLWFEITDHWNQNVK